jgi:aryl-alcohol dehydrogenase-like predicted oxidoreductase
VAKYFRDEVVIATKFGWTHEYGFDVSPSTSARSPTTACATSAPTTSTRSTSIGSTPDVPIEEDAGTVKELMPVRPTVEVRETSPHARSPA